MSLENNLQTFTKFTTTWKSSLPDVRVDGIISGYKESHRLIDNYPFYFDKNGFFVRSENEQGQSQKVYVREIIEKDSYLGAAEHQIFTNLESWFAESQEGLLIWFSPQYPPYRGHKVIIHQIAYEFGSQNKVLLNCSVMFEGKNEEFLRLIHSFFPNFRTNDNLENFRNLLIKSEADFLPDKLITEISKLDPYLLREKQVLPDRELRQRATQISQMIGINTHPDLVVNEMLRLGLIGQHSISCPTVNGKPTFSELIMGLTHHEGRSLKCTCPFCQQKVEAKIENGRITCPKCGKSAPYFC